MTRTMLLVAALLVLAAGSLQAQDEVRLMDVAPASDGLARSVLSGLGVGDRPLAGAMENALASARTSPAATAAAALQELDDLESLVERVRTTAIPVEQGGASPEEALSLVDAVGETTYRLGRLADLTVGQGPMALRAAAAVRRYTAGALTDLSRVLLARQAAAAQACPLQGEARNRALASLDRTVAEARDEVARLQESLAMADAGPGMHRYYEHRNLSDALAVAPDSGPAEAGRWGRSAVGRLHRAFSLCRSVERGWVAA